MLEFFKGNIFKDERGVIKYNNNFDASLIKRIYIIENSDTNFVRAWQGHKIEKRWFSCLVGSFRIKVIEIDHWEAPSKSSLKKEFIITAETLDFLYIPEGHVTSIQALEEGARLLVMSNYKFNEIDDEYRWNANYFND